jgi:hypothetical protein
MGYSGRYHAASLAAVFLALAVGILIGVGLGSDVVSGTAEDLERSLGSDLDQARAEIEALELELVREREFAAAVYPAVVERRLRGRRIALIGLGGLSDELTGDVEQALGPAGAKITQVAVVRTPPDLDALASTLGGRRARAVARGDAAALSRLGRRGGRALIKGSREFDELRGTLLVRYSGRPGKVDGVVLVREPPTELEPDEEAATELIEDGLVAGIRSTELPAVGVERSTDELSSVGLFDARGLSTVDSVDLQSGRVALVYALRSRALGNFGIKESADGLLPDLLARE